MATRRVVVVGAGMGGLAAAVDLAARGVDVTVIEQAATPGGKMQAVPSALGPIDAGPTVLTMRWVFDQLFDDAGASLDATVALRPAEVLARHAWPDGARLDLLADPDQTEAAIAAFAGAAEARRFALFRARAREIYGLLEPTFIRAPRPSAAGLMRRVGARGLADMARIAPFTTLWKTLSDIFRDPRLRQLFGRYATYVGSSPFLAPATLMLIAHVEQEGVWLVEGGMVGLARALAGLAEAKGACVRLNTRVREIQVADGRVVGVALEDGEPVRADAVVVNADPGTLALGHLGAAVTRAAPPPALRERSLSALTWTMLAEAEGFPLSRHTVFFSADYGAEFKDLTDHQRVPPQPTVYICAPDRDGALTSGTTGTANPGAAPADKVSSDETRPSAERLFCLINAPALGDRAPLDQKEIAQCTARTLAQMERCGLRLRPQEETVRVTTPSDFERRFPGTGGALYGRATHGWAASFGRAAARTAVPGLYLAGGSAHPGAGVPMAALSGRLAATAVLSDLTSRVR
ncbi:phytoene desaturase family protein [Pararhodospirillum oryzae]|uniref:Phytoene desaturase n=1 Tax=Pararhodospirillum oryzae TaxID=478448 RepID=A0A512H982_9PROT|nr:phytoene desaturase family protein [Pararhodospirillum oryzae]GEO82019.1 phytoene desaturase [Pararhodospirillum oryzae]